MGVETGLVDVVEEGEQPVVVPLAHGIVLVVVTAAALEREAEEGRPHRVDAVGDVFDAELLLDAPPFVGLAVQPVERRREALVARRARYEVARDLLHDEPVPAEVAVEGADDPVAPGRHVAVHVRLIAVGVGVAGQVEPTACHPLAVAGRSQEPVHDALVAAGRAVAEEGVDLVQARREPGQVQAEPANQGFARSLRLRTQSLALEPGQDEVVDPAPRPVSLLDRGRLRGSHRNETPVRPVLGASLDPAADERDLVLRHGEVTPGRRHPHGRIGRSQPAQDFAARSITRLDHPQRALAAGQAPDLEVEIDLLGGKRRQERKDEKREAAANGADRAHPVTGSTPPRLSRRRAGAKHLGDFPCHHPIA